MLFTSVAWVNLQKICSCAEQKSWLINSYLTDPMPYLHQKIRCTKFGNALIFIQKSGFGLKVADFALGTVQASVFALNCRTRVFGQFLTGRSKSMGVALFG